MDGKTVLDQAEIFIARSDVNRETLLFLLNSGVKDAMRESTVFRMQSAKTFSVVNGIASCPNLKLAKTVRFQDEEYFTLKRIPDIKQLYEIYADPTETGTPAHYIITGQSVQIVPSATGTLQIAGEFWPDDLTDSVSSTNILSQEVPNFLVFYAVGEYLDFLQEEERGNYYRGKAMAALAQWLKENTIQAMHGSHNIPRDPLGNLGYNRRTRPISKSTETGPTEGLIDDCGVYQP